MLGDRSDAARQPNRGLGPADDLDLLPRERARDAEAERLADRLLAGEAAGIALGRIRARVAVRLLRLGEAAIAKARIALERTPDPRDLDEVCPDANHRCVSSHSGTCAIDETMPSGVARADSTS